MAFRHVFGVPSKGFFSFTSHLKCIINLHFYLHLIGRTDDERRIGIQTKDERDIGPLGERKRESDTHATTDSDSFRLPSRDAMIETARFLSVPEVDVYSVATFYNQFRLTPLGGTQ